MFMMPFDDLEHTQSTVVYHVFYVYPSIVKWRQDVTVKLNLLRFLINTLFSNIALLSKTNGFKVEFKNASALRSPESTCVWLGLLLAWVCQFCVSVCLTEDVGESVLRDINR